MITIIRCIVYVGFFIIFDVGAKEECKTFQCVNDGCIPYENVNNGINDCGDNSDEDLPLCLYNQSGIKRHSYQSNEHALYDCLVKNYNKHVRPVRKEFDPITVNFGMSLIKVVDLNERDQVLSMTGWLHIVWNDSLLRWNQKLFGNVSNIQLPIDQIWKPDIVLYNNARDEWRYGPDMNALVYPSGMVMFVPHVNMKSYCQVDVTRFPFDTQTCILKFGSWTFPSHQVDIIHHKQHEKPSIDMSNYHTHQEWDITSTDGVRNEVKYPCCPESYVDMTYTLTLRRRTSHYTYMFMTPAVVLALLLPTMFLLPTGTGEKTQLGIGILVSLMLLLVALEEILPASHATLPYIGQFYIATMVLVCLSLLCAAVVSSLWMRANRKGGVPKLLRIAFLGLVSSLLCVKRDDHVPEEDDSTHMQKLDDRSYEPDPAEDRAQMVRNYARTMAVAEWRQLAAVLDRIFMILFFVLSIILAIAYLK